MSVLFFAIFTLNASHNLCLFEDADYRSYSSLQVSDLFYINCACMLLLAYTFMHGLFWNAFTVNVVACCSSGLVRPLLYTELSY